MDIQKEREVFEKWFATRYPNIQKTIDLHNNHESIVFRKNQAEAWQAAKAQAVPAQLDVNSILHDIDCYFDNGLSNTERTANNLLQSIYEKLSGEVKAQEPAND